MPRAARNPKDEHTHLTAAGVTSSMAMEGRLFDLTCMSAWSGLGVKWKLVSASSFCESSVKSCAISCFSAESLSVGCTPNASLT